MSVKEFAVNIDSMVITKPLNRFWSRCIGSDHGELFLRPAVMEHLRDGKENLGFQYARFHGIFTDITPTDPQEELSIDWDRLNDIYDRVVGLGMHLVVEFSFMPEALRSADEHIFYWNGNVSPPKDYARWSEQVEQFCRHIIDRYGEEEVLKWYFEVWNEPNLECFWSGSLEEYFKLYDATVLALKKVNPKLKVGGPVSAGGMWVREMCDHCIQNSIPCDFISYHGYPTDKGLYERDKDITYKDRDYWKLAARGNYEIVKGSLPNCEIMITEWNTTPCGQNDHSHDIANCAAYICQSVHDVEGFCDMFSYWTISDIFEELGPGDGEFYGGFGLITSNGVHKPAYNAFKLLSMLGDSQIELNYSDDKPDAVNAYAARSENGAVQVLIWNYVHPTSSDNTDANVTLSIKLPSESAYRVTSFLVDDHHSNAYARWLEMGSPKEPTQEQVQELRDAGMLEIVGNSRIEMGAGSYSAQQYLPQGSVVLILLEPEE